MGDLDDQLRRLADQRAARTPETSATAAMAAASSSGRPTPMWWLAAAAMLAVLAGAGAWLISDREDAATDSAAATTTTTPATVRPADAVQTLTAPVFGVRLEAPADWTEIESNQTWGGDSGFVAVDVAPHGTLEESLDAMLEETRGLLGSNPTIEATTVNGQPAINATSIEITASDFGELRHAVTIIESPRPISDRDEVWANLVIATDVEHHDQILQSIEWVDETPTLQHITLPDYGLEFDIPGEWKQEDDERPSWQGESGYVSIAATSSTDLDFVAENSANHLLRPYGENSTIEETTVDGRPARIIRGSEPVGDSVAAAELVASPPNQIVISGETYGSLNIYAEVDDIDAIAASIRWIVTDVPLCGPLNPSYPHEVWPQGSHGLADGTEIEIMAFEGDDGFLGLQGRVGDWYTNRVSLSPHTGDWADRLMTTSAEGLITVLLNDSPSDDFVAGRLYELQFDGCNLTADDRGVVN